MTKAGLRNCILSVFFNLQSQQLVFYSQVVSCVFGWSYLLDSDKKYVRSKSETESVCEQTDTKKIRGRKSPEPANDLELEVAGDGLNN